MTQERLSLAVLGPGGVGGFLAAVMVTRRIVGELEFRNRRSVSP